jgi:hypothetical protein
VSHNRHLEGLQRVVEEFAKEYEIGRTCSGHLAVALKISGLSRTVFFSGTPSDHRAIKNFRTNVRKLATAMAYAA